MTLLTYPRTPQDTWRPACLSIAPHLSPCPQGQIPWLYFFQSFPVLNCVSTPCFGLGSLPLVFSLLLGGVPLQFSYPFLCVFQFLLYSSVNHVVTELKSGNTWTSCMMHESLTATAQGSYFSQLFFHVFGVALFFSLSLALTTVWSSDCGPLVNSLSFSSYLESPPLPPPMYTLSWHNRKSYFSARSFTLCLGKRKLVALRYYFQKFTL